MNSYGLVFGGEKTSHDSGNDITYKVVTGNNYSQVVIEGDEYILPKEAMQSKKEYDFVDKLPIEMLDEIKRSENVFIQFPNLRHGDMVVCKNSVRNDDLHTIKGTAKEIANYLQGLSACRMYAKGGYISDELANGGGVEDESQLRLLTPMPPTKLGKTGIDSLTEIVGKDELREAMSGALYAGKGRIVATDAHILVVLENQNYPKSLDGTIKSLWNKVPQERLVGIPYPNWEAVVPNQQLFQTKELSIDDVLAYAYGGFLEGKKIIKEKDFDKYEKRIFKYILRLNIGNIEVGVDSLMLTRILRVLRANDVRKIVLHITGKQKAIKITTDKKHYGLIMPVIIADKVENNEENIYVSQQIFYPISDKDFREMSKKYGEYLTEFSKMVGGERMAEGGEITMNVPLLLRVLELAKEDVKEDKELHFIAERLQSLSKKGTLTMEDYDYISGLESNDKIQKLIAENDSNDSDLRFEQGGEIEDLISRGIVDLKMYDTTPKHAKEYGFQCLNPLFVQTICVSESKRLKGLGTKVLSYIEKYAIENGHDLIFGHITQEAKFTKDKRETFFCDIDIIKNWLHSNGYAINNENNDFHKVIQSNKLEGGGSVLLAPNGKPSNLTPEQWHLVRTPEFKAWFGDWEALENAKMRDRGMDEITLNQLAKNVSKVVDENGEPLVCNHSSREQDIDVFDGNRIFQTPNIQVKPIWFSYEGFYGKDDDILQYHCFLNVKKLFYFDKKQDLLILENYMNEKYNNYDIDSDYDYSTNWEAIEDENLPAYIFELGFDGYITNIENAVVVYNSNQIKLADGTNTTFDGNNPDIRFESGGGVLLAPNGKPSNLTTEQWHLVRTPEFKAWFGDWENSPQTASKVVDENGEPLVCYHNSRANKKFSIFIDRPTYFSNLKNYNPTDGKITYECFLQIKKPYKPKDKIHYKFIDERLEQIKRKYDGVIGKEWTYSLDVNAYVVLKSFQIKLADGTNTTFDGNNPDIRFESGGEIDRGLARKKQDISFDDFHIATFANFKKIRQVDLPKREPDFVSKSGSKYWYEGDKVYRMSNHWGRIIASCNWLLDGFAVRGLSQGYCKLKDFHREMSFLLNDKNVGKRFLVGKTSFLRSGKGAIDISENEGVFIKETSGFYVFDAFKVSKMTLAYVKPMQKVNYE